MVWIRIDSLGTAAVRYIWYYVMVWRCGAFETSSQCLFLRFPTSFVVLFLCDLAEREFGARVHNKCEPIIRASHSVLDLLSTLPYYPIEVNVGTPL